jgi:glyoxylase-like metal-dependent hydrolase (beta-lactamase superfamily II)
MLTTKVFSFSPIQENTYILYNEQLDCCIIDPGCYFPAEEDTLKRFITDQHLRPKYLLNTHCHLDHVFGNRFVHETWHLSLYLHPKEVLVLEHAPKYGERWNMPFRNYEGI